MAGSSLPSNWRSQAQSLRRSRSSSGMVRSGNDFRAHFGFLALMLVCFACTVYLMGTLRSIFRPLLWALFLVMALSPAVKLVEDCLLCLGGCLCRGATAFCRVVCWLLTCWKFLLGRSRLCCCRATVPLAAPKGRVALPGLTSASEKSNTPPKRHQSCGAGLREREVEVIGASSAFSADEGVAAVDAARAPVAVEDDTWSNHSGDSSALNPCLRMLVHGVAIAIVVAAVVLSITGLVLMVAQSVLDLQDHWPVYKLGAQNVVQSVQRVVTHATGSMPKAVAEEISNNALAKAEELLSAIVSEVIGNAWRTVLEFLMMALYIAFWLSTPMPLGSKIEALFRRYILLKGLACLGYGLCVGVLLASLGVDLAAAFGLFAFLLSFVPEVGAIVALLLPAPVILFDSRLESPAMTLFVATSAQLGLKFVFANVVEVKLVEADQLMKMHPVIILLAVTLFGLIWGPTGMLLAVPLVAYFKAALLADTVPACYRDPVLVVLEGDRSAPLKHARRRGGSPDTALVMESPDSNGAQPSPPH